jgi:hypothetical protein
MTPLESFVGEAGQEQLICSFIESRGQVTEFEMMNFLEKCGQALFTAELIKRAAKGQFKIGWSVESDDFVFGLDLKP